MSTHGTCGGLAQARKRTARGGLLPCWQTQASLVGCAAPPSDTLPALPSTRLARRSGHQSFSNNKALNDFVGNIVHSSIMVPYHGWRISHRTHHANVRLAVGQQRGSRDWLRATRQCMASRRARWRSYRVANHAGPTSTHPPLPLMPLLLRSTAMWRPMRAGTPPPSPTTRRWTSEATGCSRRAQHWPRRIQPLWQPLLELRPLTSPCPPPPLPRRWGKLGRVLFPFPLFAYPFYLFNRSPGKDGSHFDPNSPLFTPQVRQCGGQGRAGQLGWHVLAKRCSRQLRRNHWCSSSGDGL